MRSQWSQFAVAALLVVMFPASMMLAQAQGAMVFGEGGVLVNGHNVTDRTAIFSGDHIVAGKNAATLTMYGVTVVLSSGSSLAYAADGVSLQSGTAVVRAGQTFHVRVASVTITPQKDAQFSVARDGNRLQVSTARGSVALSNGKESVVIAAGNDYTIDTQQAPVMASLPSPTKSLSHEKELAIVVLMAAAAGIAWGVYQAKASPSGP